MSINAGKIFLNYRRGEDSDAAAQLYDRLEQEFPKDNLFMDIDGIGPGEDFVAVLERKIAECDVLLAVIGKNWLDVTDAKGNRRLDNPEDFVRIEIASALRLNKRIVPVLVNAAEMPAPHVLPEPLKLLARRNAARLTHERFRADAHCLVIGLKAALAEAEAERAERMEAERPAADKARRKRKAEEEAWSNAPRPGLLRRRYLGLKTWRTETSQTKACAPATFAIISHASQGGFTKRFPRATLAGAVAIAGAVVVTIGAELHSSTPAHPVAELTEPRAENGRKAVQAAEEKKSTGETERQAAEKRLFTQVAEFIARGTAHFQDHDYDRAIEAYTRAISLDPQNARAYALRSWAHLYRGDKQSSYIEDAQKAVALAPNLALGHAMLAAGYGHTGELDRGLIEANNAIEIDPKEAMAYAARGSAYARSQDYDRASADYAKAIEIDPKFARAYNYRGFAYTVKRDYNRAIADFNKAIEIDPKEAIAYHNRGFAYGTMKDYDRAIADFNKAIEIDPKYSLAYNYRGLIYYYKLNYGQAIADYTKAIEIDPQLALAYANRGSAYFDMQSYDRAIADYTKAIEIDPKSALAYNARGLAYSEKEDYSRAIADYAKAIESDPKFALAYVDRADAYYEQKNYGQAIADYTKAIEIDPKNAYAYHYRGDAYKNKGNGAKAAADHRRAKELGYKE